MEFDKAIKSIYQAEYLRKPTKADLKAILQLHKSVHGVDGMFGSLDCMHTYWKNCPKAWQGSFKGKEGHASIVMEAICDYHMFFWHASYGFCGRLNDLNILNLSPYLESLVDGSFNELELEVTPFTINNEEFTNVFVLCDGIYPQYTRFVKSFAEPITKKEKCFAGWQEACRKDIERAFGVLQSKFQFIARPILLHQLKDICRRVATCMILHNMCVSDRVMDGDVRATYNPAHTVVEEFVTVETPGDQEEVQARVEARVAATEAANEAMVQDWIVATGLSNTSEVNRDALIRRVEWGKLQNTDEHERLLNALIEHCFKK